MRLHRIGAGDLSSAELASDGNRGDGERALLDTLRPIVRRGAHANLFRSA